MVFEDALALVKQGVTMRRALWSINRYIYLVPGSHFIVNRPPLNEILEEGTSVHYNAHIDEHRANNSFGVWAIADEDVLADDWEIFND